MRKGLTAILFLVSCSVLLAQQTLNNDSVIKLLKAGLSDDLIVMTINSSPGSYDTSAKGLIALKNAGASGKVIAAIVIRAASAAPAPAAPSTSVQPPPREPLSGGAKPHQPASQSVGTSSPPPLNPTQAAPASAPAKRPGSPAMDYSLLGLKPGSVEVLDQIDDGRQTRITPAAGSRLVVVSLRAIFPAP